MLEDLEIQSISLSPAASKAVRDILSERKLDGYGLRVYLAESGCCSGVSFGMALDNNVRAEDRVVESDGIRVMVDQVSMDYLQGARIDFVKDPERGAGFVVDSPNVRVHEHAEEGCACGGSCACSN